MSDLAGAQSSVSSSGRLWNRNFLLLWQGQFVSLLGSQAFFLAVSFWLAEATGSPALLGTLLMLSILPGVLLIPFGGVLADRHSRLTVIVSLDLTRGAVMIAIAAVHTSGASIDVKVAAIAIGLFLSGLASAFFQPAITALLPDLVPRDRIAQAHSATQLSAQVASILGQAAGGILYRLLGAPLLILLDGATFILSAGSEALIRTPAPAPGVPGSPRGAIVREIREGIAWVAEMPGMSAFLLSAAALNFFSAPLLVLLPFYVTGHLGGGPQWYGFLMATLSGGAVSGSIAGGAFPLAGRTRAFVLTPLFIAAPLLLACLGATDEPFTALLLVAAAGAAAAFINVNVFAQVQRMVPAELRGRVISLVLLLAGGMAPIGMALGGVITEATGTNVAPVFLIAGGCGGLASALLLFRSAPQRFLSAEVSPPYQQSAA